MHIQLNGISIDNCSIVRIFSFRRISTVNSIHIYLFVYLFAAVTFQSQYNRNIKYYYYFELLMSSCKIALIVPANQPTRIIRRKQTERIALNLNFVLKFSQFTKETVDIITNVNDLSVF